MKWTAERPEGFFAFVAVASFGEVVLLASAGHSDRPEWDLIASVAFVAVIGYALLVVRQGASSHLAASPAYLFLVVVALWRHADGGALSGFVPLLALPVLWLALHGTWQQVWISVAGVALVMVFPIVVLGAPDYPLSDWHRTAFWIALSALMGPLLHRQVRRVASQRELYRLLVDQLPGTTIGLVDERLTWVDVAGRELANLDLDPSEMAGREVGATIVTDSRSPLRALLRSAFDGPVSGVVESDAGAWYEIDALPFRNDERRDLLLVVARDITARRLAEQEREDLHAAVAHSEERFRQVFESAPTGIALTSADGDRAGHFLQVNEAFARLLGRTRSQLEGHAIVEVTHPDDLAKTTRAGVGGDGTGGLEKRYLHASGRPVWAALSYTVLDDPQFGGRYFLTHVEDITTRKESERALLEALERQQAAADSLRAADLVRRDVISTVSHELRTPLTSIRGYVELLAEDSHLTEEERRMVDVVDRNTARLERLVEDLLLLGQVDRSAPPPWSPRSASTRSSSRRWTPSNRSWPRTDYDSNGSAWTRPARSRATGTSSTGRSPTCSPTPSSTPPTAARSR